MSSLATVLVFDEQIDSRLLLKRLLERSGHSVLSCSDPGTARKLTASCEVELVVVNLNPNHKELIADFKRTFGSKLLVIANYETGMAVPLLGDDFLVKPVDLDAIESKVRELLGS